MEIPAHLNELLFAPAVFAVKDKYQIMVWARTDVLFWVTVDGVDYHDHSNGIVRSSTRIHRVNVPMEALDKAGEYTISYRRIIERKPYFPTTEEPVSQTIKFKPVNPDGPIRIYHLSDTHGRFTDPAAAAGYFGDDLDMFILNGDIVDHSGSIENFKLIFRLCEAVTGGQRTCVFSRGNHDLRGFCAENIAEYSAAEDGHSYYSFRAGRVWGMVMDCGEDKPDDHAEYGNTVACHEFRREETEYLKKVIKNADEEFNAPGVEYRFVIVHNPFSYTINPPFDIEQPLFKEWLDLLEQNARPQAMISGHLHGAYVAHKGGNLDSKGQICPVIIGSREAKDKDGKNDFIGCAMTIEGNKMKVEFTNKTHEVMGGETIELIK